VEKPEVGHKGSGDGGTRVAVFCSALVQSPYRTASSPMSNLPTCVDLDLDLRRSNLDLMLYWNLEREEEASWWSTYLPSIYAQLTNTARKYTSSCHGEPC
jgi:hypothetical protein